MSRRVLATARPVRDSKGTYECVRCGIERPARADRPTAKNALKEARA